MHGYLVVWLSPRGTYHVEGFNDAQRAEARRAELRKMPRVLDVEVFQP